MFQMFTHEATKKNVVEQRQQLNVNLRTDVENDCSFCLAQVHISKPKVFFSRLLFQHFSLKDAWKVSELMIDPLEVIKSHQKIMIDDGLAVD